MESDIMGQVKDVEIGAYVKYGFEPSAKDISLAINLIIEKIMENTREMVILGSRVIYKTPEDYASEMRSDPLQEPNKNGVPYWTVGVKFYVESAFTGGNLPIVLQSGKTNPPIMFFEK